MGPDVPGRSVYSGEHVMETYFVSQVRLPQGPCLAPFGTLERTDSHLPGNRTEF